MTYDQIEEKIRLWAAGQESIRAVVVIGSRARTDHPADEGSDLDLILFVADQDTYAQDGAWLDSFGQVHGRFMDEWADPRALAALPGLFAPLEPEASARALREMITLFGWMSQETAVQLRHLYPTASVKQVHGWIEGALKAIG